MVQDAGEVTALQLMAEAARISGGSEAEDTEVVLGAEEVRHRLALVPREGGLHLLAGEEAGAAVPTPYVGKLLTCISLPLAYKLQDSDESCPLGRKRVWTEMAGQDIVLGPGEACRAMCLAL